MVSLIPWYGPTISRSPINAWFRPISLRVYTVWVAGLAKCRRYRRAFDTIVQLARQRPKTIVMASTAGEPHGVTEPRPHVAVSSFEPARGLRDLHRAGVRFSGGAI